MPSKAVTQANGPQLPTFAGQTGRGSENIRADDLVIPRLAIIHALSPERKKNDPAYIQGAEEGLLFNSVTRELYKEPVLVIPIYYRLEYVLWRPRSEGGGFRGMYASADEAKRASHDIPEAVEIIDTAQQFCMISSDGGKTWSEAVMSMAKSNRPVSNAWNSDIRLKCGPAGLDRFVTVYRVSAVEKSNDKGDFHIFKIQFERFLQQSEEAVYHHAESVYESIVAGTKDVDRSEGGTKSGGDDDDVGF